jgi:hypothetical protein
MEQIGTHSATETKGENNFTNFQIFQTKQKTIIEKLEKQLESDRTELTLTILDLEDKTEKLKAKNKKLRVANTVLFLGAIAFTVKSIKSLFSNHN